MSGRPKSRAIAGFLDAFDGVLTKILLITISLKIGETQGLAVFLQSKREKTKLPFQIVFALLVLAL
ncbi:hypothetical protein [Metasolibacillus sp. FSL K6-0083]|uniref:hypothetical protein n=1 Tax=Metasolibacillus sp. FSL K6-0083 TaxID=2921416 RepID=UPI00315B3AF2